MVLSVAVLVVVATTVALLRAHDQANAEAPTSTTSTSVTAITPRVPRTTTTVAPQVSVVPAAPAADCDARVINADLGYSRSGARIIDCGGGWAVMASEVSGDPFWVAYRSGHWRTEERVSIYVMTCPDEAIALGAPAWMARKHLGGCPALNPTTSSTRRVATPPTTRSSAADPGQRASSSSIASATTSRTTPAPSTTSRAPSTDTISGTTAEAATTPGEQ